MSKKNIALIIIGVILILISIWQITEAQKGLEIVNLHTSNPPVTIITPANTAAAPRPTILIAHGLAGSTVLMRGFALTLAHAGFTTVSWDFEGHGANPNPFNLSAQSNVLLVDTEHALAEAKAKGVIDTQHIAILGHSMGSGVALLYGNHYPHTSATIAVSPVDQSVSNQLPHNLLLMAGSLEPQFEANAQELLTMAGGERDDLAGGNARELVIIPNVEHISILFSPTAQATARSWLEDTFGKQPGSSDYTDRRIVWFGLGILGFMLLSNTLINSLSTAQIKKNISRSLGLRLVSLAGGGMIAACLLYLLSILGVEISKLLGMLVGGYILIWFGTAGIISLIIFRPHFSKPNVGDLPIILIAFAGLWLGVGLLGNFIWLPWLLIPERLWLWIPGAIILFPWFLSVGEAAKYTKSAGQIGWWLVQLVVVIGSLYLGIRLNPELGFLALILPLVPIMLGAHMLVVSPKHGSWAFAIPGAMFTSWLLLAAFPLI